MHGEDMDQGRKHENVEERKMEYVPERKRTLVESESSDSAHAAQVLVDKSAQHALEALSLGGNLRIALRLNSKLPARVASKPKS